MSIRSMTAYSAGEAATVIGTLGCEIRTVNSRYLELNLRLPDELRALESDIRSRIGARVARGKLEVTMRLRGASAHALELDEEMLARLAQVGDSVSARLPGVRTSLTELLAWPGVVKARMVDEAQLRGDCMALLDATLASLDAARVREGERLAAVIRERAAAMQVQLAALRGLMPMVRQRQHERLLTKLGELQAADPGRLEQELVLALQKLDVEEELDRLASHLHELEHVLASDEPVGRRMDFLLQEFNREANTLGSKSVDVRSSAAAVELKVLIEQIREQVQNIE